VRELPDGRVIVSGWLSRRDGDSGDYDPIYDYEDGALGDGGYFNDGTSA
jgi:hypothetical protein